MKTLLKQAREASGMKMRELAEKSGIDQALISKFENGLRIPTKSQLLVLSELLQINSDEILLLWWKEKISALVDSDPIALKALSELGGNAQSTDKIPEQFSKLLEDMNALKSMMSEGRK